MKRFLILIAALAPCLCAAQNPHLSYIEKYAPLAVAEMQRTGVPASITLAQALVESGAGRSPLAVEANNHFGIKCHEEWDGETFYKDDDSAGECFRAYASVEESYRAHSDFLRSRERYQSLFDLEPTDYKAWAKGLKKAGYATDARYANKLIESIEDFQLYRYDQEALAQAAPVAASAPDEADEQRAREEEYRRKVIAAFFEYGRLRSIPVQRKKKQICYERIAECFEIGRVYEEKEVNEIISPIHEDYCTIRRDMISEGIFRRDGNRYVRLK